jgi:hypothetical protein
LFCGNGKGKEYSCITTTSDELNDICHYYSQRHPVWASGSGSDCCENYVPLYVYCLSANARNGSYTCLLSNHAGVAPSIQDRAEPRCPPFPFSQMLVFSPTLHYTNAHPVPIQPKMCKTQILCSQAPELECMALLAQMIFVMLIRSLPLLRS